MGNARAIRDGPIEARDHKRAQRNALAERHVVRLDERPCAHIGQIALGLAGVVDARGIIEAVFANLVVQAVEAQMLLHEKRCTDVRRLREHLGRGHRSCSAFMGVRDFVLVRLKIHRAVHRGLGGNAARLEHRAERRGLENGARLELRGNGFHRCGALFDVAAIGGVQIRR